MRSHTIVALACAVSAAFVVGVLASPREGVPEDPAALCCAPMGSSKCAPCPGQDKPKPNPTDGEPRTDERPRR